MVKEKIIADSEHWRQRGIPPYLPEVVAGYDKDGPLDESVVLALSTLMTNVGKPTFAFTDDMPEEVAAALFSRYSRSPRPLRMVLAREFLSAEGLNLSWVGLSAIADVARARQFFARVLAEYGDDSVAQLGRVRLACEMVSQLAVKEVEDGRLVACIEKSSRYVDFGTEVNGSFMYFRPVEVMQTTLAQEYEGLMNEAFLFYREAAAAMRGYLQEKFPRQEGMDERVWKASIRAKAFDIVRVFLPMSTLTNVGMTLSGQSAETMINKMMASPLEECRTLAAEIKGEVDQVIPSLVSRIGEEKYGGRAREYLQESGEATKMIASGLLARLPELTSVAKPGVELVWSSQDALDRVVSAILYPHAGCSLGDIRDLVRSLSDEERKRLVDAYVSGRTDRRHKPGRAFEMVAYGFSFTGNVGIWRDLQRHRMLTQQRQLFTTEVGIETPPEFNEVGIEGRKIAEVYQEHMEKRGRLFKRVADRVSPEVAQYIVAFGNLMHWTITANLREIYHLVPLRASPAGHPAYRKIAREMFYAIAEVDPILAMPMERFIDFSDEPRLERLAQLAKVKKRLDGLGGRGADTFGE